MSIYLDHNATTPPAEEVVAEMVRTMVDGYGNPASSHAVGRAAAARVTTAAERVAALLGTSPSRIVWTSGATEALNTAIAAAVAIHPRVVVARTEHTAVLDTVKHLAARGVSIAWVDVDDAGQVTPAAVAAAAPPEPFVLVAMAANNETGVLNDVTSLASFVHERGGLVVCDVTQQLGKLPVDVDGWSIDYAAASAHKLYGPQGVGVLVVPSGAPPTPVIRGGGHQRGWRSGTLNVAGIVGFGVACDVAGVVMDRDAARLAGLRDRLAGLLEARLGPLAVNGAATPARLPNTLNVHIPGVSADALIVNCPDVAFSSGSACTSAVPTASHVLRAMGLSEAHAEESVRLSLGRGNDLADIEQAATALTDAAVRIRQLVEVGL